MTRGGKAVALYSGGLDSTLAILALMRQGIEMKAVTFLNHFGCDITDKSSCSKNPFSAAEKFGFEVKLSHLSDKFISIVKNPKFGHGKNMNPCVDCRILMLREAAEFMRMTGAEFVVTGEVLGQRPMSQRRDALDIIDREAGLKGLVVRPLCAKHLKPTIPEQKGIIARDLMYDFSGRSRKPQIALAAEFGLSDYPAPAGGCLLTDPNYSYRLKELLTHDPDPSLNDLHLLRVGRHFRYSPGTKIIVGRNSEENDAIVRLIGNGDCFMRVLEHSGPITILRGDINDVAISTAAGLCARYSGAKHLASVEVEVSRMGKSSVIRISPAEESLLKLLKIENIPEQRQSLRR